MSAYLFDGKEKARQIQAELEGEIAELGKKNTPPYLVSIVLGDNKNSFKYLSLKKAGAEKIGAKVEIRNFPKDTSTEEIVAFIKETSERENVHGVMLQLPLPELFSKKEKEEIIKNIPKSMDVDGMREDSRFVAPVVRAVIIAIKEAQRFVKTKNTQVVVVGSKGFVGGKLIKILKEMDYEVKGYDKDAKSLGEKIKEADILISAVGKHGLIKKSMIKKDSAVVDIGSPRPDVEKSAKEKAAFLTPVPGGIGPLTIACLLENLVEAARQSKN